MWHFANFPWSGDHLKGQAEALEGLAVEMLARGLSVRDIEDAFRDESGRLLLSKTAVAEMSKQLWGVAKDIGECFGDELSFCSRVVPTRSSRRREAETARLVETKTSR
jgi:hypothetical protein